VSFNVSYSNIVSLLVIVLQGYTAPSYCCDAIWQLLHILRQICIWNAVSRAEQSNAPLVKTTDPISVHGRVLLPMSSKWSFSFRFPHQNPVSTTPPPAIHATFPTYLIFQF